MECVYFEGKGLGVNRKYRVTFIGFRRVEVFYFIDIGVGGGVGIVVWLRWRSSG